MLTGRSYILSASATSAVPLDGYCAPQKTASICACGSSRPASAYASYAASTIMSWGSLSQFSPNLQHPMPTMATLSRIAWAFIAAKLRSATGYCKPTWRRGRVGSARGAQRVGLAREGDREGRARPEMALDPDLALQLLDQATDDVEAEPHPAVGPPIRAVDLPEHLEDVGQILARDAHAGVAHAEDARPL